MQGERQQSRFILLCVNIQFPQHKCVSLVFFFSFSIGGLGLHEFLLGLLCINIHIWFYAGTMVFCTMLRTVPGNQPQLFLQHCCSGLPSLSGIFCASTNILLFVFLFLEFQCDCFGSVMCFWKDSHLVFSSSSVFFKCAKVFTEEVSHSPVRLVQGWRWAGACFLFSLLPVGF